MTVFANDHYLNLGYAKIEKIIIDI